MTAAGEPIPEELVKTFRSAIHLVRYWRQAGGPEPIVVYQRIARPISSIAYLVSGYEDRIIPHEEYVWVCDVAGSLVDHPTARDYAAGGACIYQLCLKLQERFRGDDAAAPIRDAGAASGQ